MTGNQTVMVVDDERTVAETYAEVLEEAYTVEVAHSGREALDGLSAAIDVVLLDRRMPGMSGDELLEEIRTRAIDCRVVMITAVEPDTSIVGMAFDEYLVKPVSESQLRDVVERMFTRKRLDARIQQMVGVASRLATLESKLDYEQLERSEEYAALREEFDRLRGEVTLPDDDEYVRATIEKLDALLKERQ